MEHDRPNESADHRSVLHRFEAVLDVTDTVIWEVSLEDADIEFYGPVESIVGITPEALTDPVDVNRKTVHPDDRAAVFEAFDELVSGEVDTIDVEYRTNPEHGPVRWVRTQSFREPETGTERATLAGMTTDITDQKENERRLETFAAVVSHDLRNPLSVASGRLELARLAALDGEYDADQFEAAERALERMEALIDDLLSLTRGNEDVGDHEPVHLERVTNACWAVVRAEGVTLVVDADETICADESRLKQLLENLFRNAAEHAGDDVNVTVGLLDDGFYVEDDGVGIPESERPHLLRQSWDDSAGHSGLGLRIVTQIADAHGWDIDIVTGSDGGARFEITGVSMAPEACESVP